MSTADPIAILPVFLPRRGCPGHCSFCDQRAQTAVTAPTPESAGEELRTKLTAMQAAGRAGALAFYGGSFDGLSDEERAAWMDLAGTLARDGLIPGGLRVSAHPAGLDPARIHEFAEGGVGVVEIGVQSLDDRVLVMAGRGHDAAGALAACSGVMRAGLGCIVQLMAGLPGADRASDLQTAEGIAGVAPDGVRIHPTLALRGTRLGTLVESGEWSPPVLDEAVDRVADMATILEEAGVAVVRLGIQDVAGFGGRVIAGAWHPAFGELVRGEMLARRLASEMGDGKTVVQIPRREASRLLGHGRWGQRRLEVLVGRKVEILLLS